MATNTRSLFHKRRKRIAADVTCTPATIPQGCTSKSTLRFFRLVEVGEALAAFGELLQQWGRRPEATVLLLELANPLVDLLQTHGVGILHRPAAVRGIAVAQDVEHVDVD